MSWHPATADEIVKIVAEDLKTCNDNQIATYKKYALEPYAAPILRYGKMETVIIVARKKNEVIYWEDVEEGFNISSLAADGQILEHKCNQDDLGIALNSWIS